MSEFTREQIIEAAKQCLSGKVCRDCPLAHEDGEDVKGEFILSLTAKENEPAPSDNNTSSKENILYKDDSTALKICQGALLKIEKCSSDGWTRGYCTAVRGMFEAQKEETNV